MRNNIRLMATLTLVLGSLTGVSFGASECAANAKVFIPAATVEAQKGMEMRLDSAKKAYFKKPKEAEALIWYGRRTAYLGRYKEAITIYTNGIKKHPEDARMYRHRGHRYISLRCFDDAISDFERAAELIKGKPDEIEPDGIPNARNTPTSTLQSNIWYHLGLAHYLKGDFEKALVAYVECLDVSKNPDMLVATANWYFVTAKRLGKSREARDVLNRIGDNLDIIENDSYYDLIKLYQGKLKHEDVAGSKDDSLTSASVLYGAGNWALLNNNKQLAADTFKRVVATSQWSSFGYIAAEAELERMKAVE